MDAGNALSSTSSIMLVGRTGRRGTNGTLKPTTARKRSGRRSAACHATGAPQSCPTITAVSVPSASTRPPMSPTDLQPASELVEGGPFPIVAEQKQGTTTAVPFLQANSFRRRWRWKLHPPLLSLTGGRRYQPHSIPIVRNVRE